MVLGPTHLFLGGIVVVCFYLLHIQLSNPSCSFTRQIRIKENMKKMPQMIADYRKQVYELRAKTKKKRTEEEEYLLATGKKQREGPFWQVLKDASKRKR